MTFPAVVTAPAAPRCTAGGRSRCPESAVAELLVLTRYAGRMGIRWVPRCATHLARWNASRIRPLRNVEMPA